MNAKLLKKKNYLAMIENAAKGENWMFRNFYIETDSKELDVLNDGHLSCATFASSILYLFNSVLEFLGRSKWIGFTHANTSSTEKDMLAHGWLEIKELKPGAVLIWEKKLAKDDNKEYLHIGFYIGNDMAISNDSQGTGFPHKHQYTYSDTRKIEKIYWHPALGEE
ncbi:MAG: hypothetical protein Q8R55_01775 [Candidatus Taylorbacteria bacterium]|nr:hypothetical protein [Candidatus Taylorbacteria bacterium]